MSADSKDVLERIKWATKKLLDSASVDQILVWWKNHTKEYRQELRKGLDMLALDPEYTERVGELLGRLPPESED